MAPETFRPSAARCASAACSKENLAPICTLTCPLAIASNTALAFSYNKAAVALCGNTEGLVKNRQPFLFKISG